MSRSSFFCHLSVFYGILLFVPPCSIGNAQDQPNEKSEIAIDESIPKHSLITREFPGPNWTFFSGKRDAKFSETWNLEVDQNSDSTYIVCSGQPYGYIRTKSKFRDFDFGLEWRFPNDENGNSGILLFTNGDNRIWPTSLQVQLQQPLAGSSFPSGSAKSANELRNVPMLSRPVNQWNRCLITARNGNVTIVVNGQKVGTVKDCKPLAGAISLQSEGSEIHFRNIWIREYPLESNSISQLKNHRRMRFRRQTFENVFIVKP